MSSFLKCLGVVVLVATWGGCQNQELLRYQEENLMLQEQLEVSEQKLTETRAMYDEMFELIQMENEKLQKALQATMKPTKEIGEEDLKETIKLLRQQLDERTKTLLLAQQEIKKLQEKIKELEKKIKG